MHENTTQQVTGINVAGNNFIWFIEHVDWLFMQILNFQIQVAFVICLMYTRKCPK